MAVIFLSNSASKVTAQPAVDPLDFFWRVDGRVNTVVENNGLLYVGGDFGYVGPASGAAGVVNLESGRAAGDFPYLVGRINAAAPDGSGGWYVGGEFVPLGGGPSNLVHVLPNRKLNTFFKPNPNRAVQSLLLVDGKLFVGGEFRQIANANISTLAALDPITGETNEWSARIPNGGVAAMVAVGDTLYVGGSFSGVNSQSRRLTAAFSLADASLKPWNPGLADGSGISPQATVRALAAGDGVIYVGGDFSIYGGKPRRGLAALDATTGLATTWDPRPSLVGGNPRVNSMIRVNDTLLVAGEFTSIGAKNINNLGVVSTVTAVSVPEWNTGANAEVLSIGLVNDEVIAVGRFNQLGAAVRQGIGRAKLSDGSVSPWAPLVSTLRGRTAGGVVPPVVTALSLSGAEGFIGGDFASFGGVARSRLAAFDPTTGQPTTWNPGADGEVLAISPGQFSIFVGGQFNNLGGVFRPRLGAVRYFTGEVADWDPRWNSPTGSVTALTVTSTNVFVGGFFTELGGSTRTNLASLDSTSAAATPWVANTTGRVNTLLVNSNVVYVGGQYNAIGGFNRTNLSAFAMSETGVSQFQAGFFPAPDGAVQSVVLDGNRLIVAGFFNTIGRQARKGLAAVDLTTGLEGDLAWDVGIIGAANVGVRTALRLGKNVYVGGNFTAIGGEFLNRAAAVTTTLGTAIGWNPNPDGPVSAFGVAGPYLIMAGDFTRVDDRTTQPANIRPTPFLAAYDGRAAIDTRTFTALGGGKYRFELTDGDGRGSGIAVQASEGLDGQPWQTVKTLPLTGTKTVVEDVQPEDKAQLLYRLLITP